MKTWQHTFSVLPFTLLLSSSAWAASASSEPVSKPAAPFEVSQQRGSDILPELAPQNSPFLTAQAPVPSQNWAMILEKYVSPKNDAGVALFNYGALTANAKDRAALDDYITSLEAEDINALPAKEATVTWANLYNAVTIKVVVDNYPVDSIRDIKSGWRAGPWKKDLVTVSGKDLSLDDIEHKILRKEYPSPLIHYMVNCASIGCPNLKATPWDAETMDADRELAAKTYINSARGVTITEKGLKVSSIYKWFKEDFGGDNDGVLAHLRKYADADLAAAIDGGAKIDDDDYNWSLNDTK